MAGRRERLRAQTIRDIKAAALARLRADGDVSLRAVARDIGMSAPGLYRYYDSRDDLLTALIADGYHALADAMETALGIPSTRPADDDAPPVVPTHDEVAQRAAAADADPRPPATRYRLAARAYRDWSVANPGVFGLLYGDPLPGYAAPAGGATVTATQRVGRALLQPLFEAVLSGRLTVPASYADAATSPEMAAFADELEEVVGLPIPEGTAPMALAAWGRLHGLVSLEVFGQYHWVFPDGAEALFEADLDATVEALFLEDPS